jgi:hypothetical protein
MKIKIYQPFFKDEDIPGLDPDSEHLDFRNQSPEDALLREHTINRRCRELAIEQGLDVWGMVSWKYRQKVRDITGIDFSVHAMIEYIKSHPNKDVYFFNVYPIIVDQAYNAWEHGQWYHPHMIEICEELFPLIDLDPLLLYLPMGPEVSCYANYYMGNQTFWDGWLELIEKYIAAIPKLSDRVRQLHNGPSDYGPFPDLWYFPFIHERLFSTYLLSNYTRFQVQPGHLGTLGECAGILSHVYTKTGELDVDIAKTFLEFRKNKPSFLSLNKEDLASGWLEKMLQGDQ